MCLEWVYCQQKPKTKFLHISMDIFVSPKTHWRSERKPFFPPAVKKFLPISSTLGSWVFAATSGLDVTPCCWSWRHDPLSWTLYLCKAYTRIDNNILKSIYRSNILKQICINMATKHSGLSPNYPSCRQGQGCSMLLQSSTQYSNRLSPSAQKY